MLLFLPAIYLGYVAVTALAAALFEGCVATLEPPSKPDPKDGGGEEEKDAANGVDAGTPSTDGGAPVTADAGDAGSPSSIDGGEADGGVDGGGVDGGSDAGIPPVREGINERWAESDNCDLISLDILPDQKLYALCEGKPSHLSQYPLSNNLDAVTEETVVPFTESPYEGDNPLELVMIAHSDLGHDFSLVSFSSEPNDRPGFFIVNRATRAITAQVAIPPQSWGSGGGTFSVQPAFPFGAALMALGDGSEELLVAAREWRGDTGAPVAGDLLEFAWNGDGSFSAGTPFLRLQNTTSFNPTLFLKQDDALSILDNGSWAPAAPAVLDRVVLNDDGLVEVDAAQALFIGDVELEPLKSLAVSYDQSAILMASGSNLVMVLPQLTSDNIFSRDVEGEGIVAVQWLHQGNNDYALVSDSSRNVFTVPIFPDHLDPVSNSIPLLGDPFASALDASAGIFYQGMILEGHQSVITAIRTNVLVPSP